MSEPKQWDAVQAIAKIGRKHRLAKLDIVSDADLWKFVGDLRDEKWKQLAGDLAIDEKQLLDILTSAALASRAPSL